MGIFAYNIVDLKTLKGNAALKLSRFFVGVETSSMNSIKLQIDPTILGLNTYAGFNYEVADDTNTIPCDKSLYDGICVIGYTDSIVHHIAYSKIIDETKFVKKSFEIELWNTVSSLLTEGREEEALVYLYKELNQNLSNYDLCDDFLKYIIDVELTTDVIVHILNALSPIKSLLHYWDPFTKHAHSSLLKTVGESATKSILNVIV